MAISNQKQSVPTGTAQIVNGELIYSISEEQAKSSSGPRTIPDDDYMLKIVEVVPGVGKESGEPYVNFKTVVTGDGEVHAGFRLNHICSLTDKNLWKLHGTLEALGIPVQAGQSVNRLKLDGVIGKHMGATVRLNKKTGYCEIVKVFNLNTVQNQEM